MEPGDAGGFALLVITALLWSFGGVLIKWVSWNPMAIAGMRSAFALPFLLIVFRPSRLDWSKAQIGGAVCYTVTVILFVMSNKLTTAANAILLQYTAPVYVALLSYWFLKERVTWADWAAIFAALSGMVLFFLDKLSTGGFWGNVLAVISGMSFGTLILFMRKQKGGNPLGSIFLGNAFTALIGLPFMFGGLPDAKGWLGLALLGFFQLGLSYVCYSIAIRRVTALQGIMIPIIEPVLNPVWVFIFIGEEPGRWAILGGIIVIGSVISRSLLRRSSQRIKED
jgi:drug/metabolite transporter (DMT)-like permease